MRSLLFALPLLAAVPAAAQDAGSAATTAAAPRAGQVLRGANNARLGQIDRVGADGSVRIIFESRLVTVPAGTISMVEGKPVSTLTKREVGKLR